MKIEFALPPTCRNIVWTVADLGIDEHVVERWRRRRGSHRRSGCGSLINRELAYPGSAMPPCPRSLTRPSTSRAQHPARYIRGTESDVCLTRLIMSALIGLNGKSCPAVRSDGLSSDRPRSHLEAPKTTHGMDPTSSSRSRSHSGPCRRSLLRRSSSRYRQASV